MADTYKQRYIIDGFSEDFQQIKEEFPSCSKDLRLEDFFVYWRKSYMDCIFANRFDPRELLESIDEINRKLVSVITNDLMNCEAKLVALYILICLSAKQPHRLRRQIRLTCDDALKVQRLSDEVAQSRGHDDARFCWFHLRNTDAIDFVQEKLIFGPSMLTRRSHHQDEEAASSNDPIPNAQNDTKEFLEDKFEPVMRDLEQLCDQYKQIKDILELDDAHDATVELDSKGSSTDYVEQAKSLLRDYKASQA